MDTVLAPFLLRAALARAWCVQSFSTAISLKGLICAWMRCVTEVAGVADAL